MSEQITRLMLIRHGHNPYLDAHRLAGRLPGVHLSEKGQAQAHALAARLAQTPIAAIYSSPMERAQETAEPTATAHSLPVMICEDLNESDCGEWTGRSIEELTKTDIWPKLQAYPSGTAHPGGECITDIQARMVRGLNMIAAAHPGGLILAFSHADPIKAALTHYAGTHLDLFQRLVIDPASLSELAFTPAGPRLVRTNDTAHLS